MKERWGAFALVVMLVADAILVAFAMGLLDGDKESSPSPPSSSTSSSGPSITSSRSEPDSSRLLLDAVDDQHAWRARYVPCDKDGSAGKEIERTSDGGATWASTEVPARTVLRLRMSSATEGFAVIADEGCTPKVVATSDGGKSWGQPEAAASTWGLWPEPGPRILGPGGQPAAACTKGDAISLSALDGQVALVLCEGGVVRKTVNAGQSWSDLRTVQGALALSARDGTLAVLVETKSCQGLGVLSGRLGGETSLGEAVCLPLAQVPAALTLSGSGGWLSAGDNLWLSDDLDTWTESGA